MKTLAQKLKEKLQELEFEMKQQEHKHLYWLEEGWIKLRSKQRVLEEIYRDSVEEDQEFKEEFERDFPEFENVRGPYRIAINGAVMAKVTGSVGSTTIHKDVDGTIKYHSEVRRKTPLTVDSDLLTDKKY